MFKGIELGSKETILNMMLILYDILSQDDKYYKIDGIKRCCIKANILAPACNQGINNKVGSDFSPERYNNISDE